MAGPITLKAGAYPAVADGLEGFQELTVAEIKNQVAGEITLKFATDTDGSGTAELNVVTGGSAGSDEIGTFTNRERQEAVGVHPAGGATTDTVYRFNQISATATENHDRPLRWTDTSIEESTDSEIDTEILDHCIKAMVDEDANTVGQYKIDTSTPSGGTWTARYTIAETQVDGTDVNYYLWQKTAPTTDAGTNENILLKANNTTGAVIEMAESSLHKLVPAFQNRIIASGIGTYLLESTTPSVTGTWAQMGGTMTDQLKDITSANYAGDYTGSYVGYYQRFFGGFLNGAFAGTYSGTFTGFFAGNTVQSSSSTQETKQLFVSTD